MGLWYSPQVVTAMTTSPELTTRARTETMTNRTLPLEDRLNDTASQCGRAKLISFLCHLPPLRNFSEMVVSSPLKLHVSAHILN